MIKKRFWWVAIVFMLTHQYSFGQLILSGKIYDEDTGNPIELVTIHNISQKIHTHSNQLGKFTIENVYLGDSLSFHFIGYASKIIEINNKDELNIALSQAPIELAQVTITPSLYALNSFTDIDLNLNPVSSSQEVLNRVPGLFIAQHAGGGKAEQIFLRGFDIDHGTDIQITADGIPVNMVSHAHGQGYSDLHFLIPETIQKIDFGKGPYYSNKGNFSTAGYVDLRTTDRLQNSLVKLEGGDFNTMRMVGLVDLVKNKGNADAYIAAEYYGTDGYFESPQNFNRMNVFGKFITKQENYLLKVRASTFSSKWDASGQIPVRAVNAGTISHFGAIDDTEGGETSRMNFAIDHTQFIDNKRALKTKVYIVNYDFELYSNFTFFLNNPENGDQIRQKEERLIYGWQSSYQTKLASNFLPAEFSAGAGFRYDDINDNELSRTKNRRETLSRVTLGDVNELNAFLFSDLEIESGKFLINAGLRLDYFDFDYSDKLAINYTNLSTSRYFVSSKLNIIFNPSTHWQLYVKTGRGFHSNEARTVLNGNSNNIIPAAYGIDVGGIFKPTKNVYIDLGFWHLYLEDELVYVGDEGIVEPSGKTVRSGVDVNVTWQLNQWLFADASLNVTNPKSLENIEGENFIPLAPDLTSTGGLSINHPSGISGRLSYRYLGDRPANEDNSLVAEGYFLTDLTLNYDRKNWGINVFINNIFDIEWKETQFETESRLQNELNPVNEIHFTPGTPLFLKAGLSLKF